LLSDKIIMSPSERSRLRLQAAVSLAYLSAIDTYAQATASHFVLLALTIQDTCFDVRSRFLTKIIHLLHTRVLPSRFNVVPFLTVFDPDEEIKNIASAYIMGTLQRLGPRLRLQQFEMTFPRLLHLLAHHPDFEMTHTSVVEVSRYIKFYLLTVTTADNISLIFHLAEKSKTVRDAESDQYSERVYALSDLSQRMIQSYARSRSWTLTNIPAGKTKLPSDIFHPLPDAATANKILRTRYLPDETYQWLEGQGNITKPEPKERAEGTKPRKRKAKADANGTTKRPKKTPRRRKNEESESEESSSQSEGEDDEDQDEDQEMVSEPDHGHSGPPNTDTEEEVIPEGEPRRRSARTVAKARIKQQIRRSKHTKG